MIVVIFMLDYHNLEYLILPILINFNWLELIICIEI